MNYFQWLHLKCHEIIRNTSTWSPKRVIIIIVNMCRNYFQLEASYSSLIAAVVADRIISILALVLLFTAGGRGFREELELVDGCLSDIINRNDPLATREDLTEIFR